MKKKFVSIIWGYPKHFPNLVLEENCYLHILNIALRNDMDVYIIVKDAKKIIENDPNLDQRIKVLDYGNFFNFLFKIIKFSISNSIFYVNSYEWQSFLIPFMARRTIFMAHTQPKRKTRAKQIFQNFIYMFFTAIRLNNDTEKDFLIKEKINPKKLFVIPLVVSDNIFKLTNTQINNRKDLVYFGNVTLVKNLSTILKAFSIVKENHKQIRLNIIGHIYDHGFYDQIQEMNLADNIKIHGFIHHGKKLSDLLNENLVFVNSSISEGQCVAVYDAALCGCVLCLPNIMSFVGVFKDKALFHDVIDYNKLAKNINYYLDNIEIAYKHSRSCIEMIKEDFSKEIIEKKMEELLKKI
jgi:glycosyltransferase involved in cell wall biosynthesis